MLTPVELDPRSFDWYLDPDVEVLVGCFAFGTGVAEADVAALGRQLAVEFSEVLRIRDAFITVPQFVVVEDREPASPVGRPGPRSAFAVFRSLPQTQMVAAMSRQMGARLALTGRLVGAGKEFKIGVNLIDVERLTLLGCCYKECERESLLEAVTEISLYLLKRFVEVEDDVLLVEIRDAIGTQDYRAFYHWALACDMDRSASAGVKPLDMRRLIDRLRFGVGRDPGHRKMLDRLVDIFETLSVQGDTRLLLHLANSLEYVPLMLPTVSLIRAEAYIACFERQRAREVLEPCMQQFPNHPHAFFLMGELEAPEQPGLAMTYFQRAAERAPKHPVYQARFEQATQDSIKR